MRRLFVFLTAILTILTATAQDEHSIILDQSSVRKMINSGVDNANIDPIRKDSSRNACARVKIRFANMNRAEVDALRVQFRSNTDLVRQEIGYYDNILILEMTAKPMTRFYVQSPEYGQSNEVSLNLEGNCEYEMEARLNHRFSIVVHSNVAGAHVYIDGVKKAVTDAKYEATIDDVMVGSHTLKLAYNGIVAEQSIEVKKGVISFRQDIDQSALQPQYVVFSVTPENAVVIVDNQHHTLVEGMVMLVRPRGTYNYTVTAAGYHSQSGTFTVEGQKIEKMITLKADAANVTLTAPGGAEIWVNGVQKGTGRWSGMLASGTYIFEARKAGHKSSMLSKTITSAAANQSYALSAPTPIVGKVTISSTPLMADVTLDGKPVGRTPIDIPNLLVGSHTIKISKAGYANNTQTITISEDKTTTVNATLTKQSTPTPTPATSAQSGSYKIGDLVTVNGVQGIVFQTSPVVKIVSVKETTAKWGEYEVTTNATDKDNGKANMTKIKSISGWQSKYPAFKWCADLGEGWYLPAQNELKAIYNQKDAINKALSANGFDSLCSKDKYGLWSSSEASSDDAVRVSFSDGFGISVSKSYNYAVRAVFVLDGRETAVISTPASKPTTPKPATPSSTGKTYKVGDYYNEHGKEGVVFEVTDGGRHGKIVSMKRSKKRLQWSSDSYEQRRLIGANSKTDGAYNMSKVKAVSGWQSKYPAFKWCADLGDGWYLPAKEELLTIYKYKVLINDNLRDKLTERNWSSTEENVKYLGEFCAWIVDMDDGGTTNLGKFSDYYVRAVSAF